MVTDAVTTVGGENAEGHDVYSAFTWICCVVTWRFILTSHRPNTHVSEIRYYQSLSKASTKQLDLYRDSWGGGLPSFANSPTVKLSL